MRLVYITKEQSNQLICDLNTLQKTDLGLDLLFNRTMKKDEYNYYFTQYINDNIDLLKKYLDIVYVNKYSRIYKLLIENTFKNYNSTTKMTVNFELTNY